MANSENNIPTLNDIAHVGKQEMLNHFDGHQFEDETTENSLSFENASDIENQELQEVPSITIEESDTDLSLAAEDFSEAMLDVATKKSENELNKTDIKELINQAITEALPGIEAQLKGKLYSKFGI